MEMDILALALRRAAILNGLLLADHVFIGVVTLDINVATDSQFLTDIARHNADGDQLVLAGGLFAQRIVQRRRNRLFAEALQLIPSLTVALAGGGFCFLGLFSRRVIGFLPQRYTLLQFGHALAVGVLCRPVLRRLAAE